MRVGQSNAACPGVLPSWTCAHLSSCTPILVQIKKLQEDADGHKAACAEYQRGLDTIQKTGNLHDLQRELMDTVRRMAVVQIKHAKVARQLEASELSERALQERVEELEQEVRDISNTCRSRMRWLEQAADAAKRRVDNLFRELQASVPLAVRVC